MGHHTHTPLTRARGGIVLDHDAIAAHAVWLGADAATAARAAEAVMTGRVVLLAATGWMGSGKDTIAPLVLDAAGTGGDRLHAYFAKALKGEVNDRVLPVLTESADSATAARRLVAELDIQPDQATVIAERLVASFAPGHDLTAYSRTPEIRWLLQRWGTDVRRAQDPDYWVKQALLPVVEAIAQGRDVFITDARFPNEVEGAQRLGFHVVRLEINPDTQRTRLMDRDGLTEEQYHSATGHPSETALDDYPGFDVVIDNNGGVASIPAVIREVLATTGVARDDDAVTAVA